MKKTQTDSSFQYIADGSHYSRVIEKISTVKKQLWIGTADIKDLYVKKGRKSVPLLEILSALIDKGVEIRLIHAKEPGKAFREDFDRFPNLINGIERILCPRVHFKMIIFDLKEAYVGSANLTGAGLGMKGEHTRNFETGVLSTDSSFVREAVNHFDRVWMGEPCKKCMRKKYCSDPIISQ
jgi:phosphatidylserine/phosphatidylglycerophosphate/cardiolipin synthase-like enzyme